MKITFKTLLTLGLLFAIISNAQATEITNTSATGTTVKFKATLDAPLTTGNKVKIDFGKGGLKAMSCNATTCTLSSNALPSGISTATYKIGIYDAKNVLQGSTSDGTYVITSNSSAPVSNYTKIANDGSELSDSAKLGSNPKDWACTKDNKTGLIWEVKTSDGGLRDKYWNYSWYEPDANKNGGDIGQNGNDYRLTWCKGSNCDTYAFTNAVNTQSLCGANDWRMPTKYELLGIVKSDSMPIIDTTYFPDIKDNDWFWFWSSSINESDFAWYVNFDYRNSISNDYGNSLSTIKSLNANVRLVRNTK